MSLNSEHTEASFSPNSTYLLCLQYGQVPIRPDLVIVVSTMTTTTRPITLHARGVIIIGSRSNGLDLHHTSSQVHNYYN